MEPVLLKKTFSLEVQQMKTEIEHLIRNSIYQMVRDKSKFATKWGKNWTGRQGHVKFLSNQSIFNFWNNLGLVYSPKMLDWVQQWTATTRQVGTWGQYYQWIYGCCQAWIFFTADIFNLNYFLCDYNKRNSNDNIAPRSQSFKSIRCKWQQSLRPAS